MIDFDVFRFASAPRTATTWIRKAAVMAGLRDAGRNLVHFPHDVDDKSVIKLSCVRHPCDWLASYHAAIYPGLVGIPLIDELRPGDFVFDFDDFIRYYLAHVPGRVGQIFDSYNADTYIRVEDLPWAFIDFLEPLGVPRSLRERCVTTNAQNITKRERLPLWSPSLRARVLEAEQKMLDRFDY